MIDATQQNHLTDLKSCVLTGHFKIVTLLDFKGNEDAICSDTQQPMLAGKPKSTLPHFSIGIPG